MLQLSLDFISGYFICFLIMQFVISPWMFKWLEDWIYSVLLYIKRSWNASSHCQSSLFLSFGSPVAVWTFVMLQASTAAASWRELKFIRMFCSETTIAPPPPSQIRNSILCVFVSDFRPSPFFLWVGWWAALTSVTTTFTFFGEWIFLFFQSHMKERIFFPLGNKGCIKKYYYMNTDVY